MIMKHKSNEKKNDLKTFKTRNTSERKLLILMGEMLKESTRKIIYFLQKLNIKQTLNTILCSAYKIGENRH